MLRLDDQPAVTLLDVAHLRPLGRRQWIVVLSRSGMIQEYEHALGELSCADTEQGLQLSVPRIPQSEQLIPQDVAGVGASAPGGIPGNDPLPLGLEQALVVAPANSEGDQVADGLFRAADAA